MPRSWSAKDERKYEHIRTSQERRGVRVARAREIASRTVNRDRRRQGRTPSRSTQGTGNPRTSLEERSVVELRNRAAQLHIDGRSTMRKAELVQAIRDAR